MENKYKYVAVRDSNTVGLTGKLHYDEVNDNQYGNLLKLIYEISKPQEAEGAGGSWGLGCCFYYFFVSARWTGDNYCRAGDSVLDRIDIFPDEIDEFYPQQHVVAGTQSCRRDFDRRRDRGY